MEEFYKNKYLKYKQKYLDGGVCANCAKIGFQQHHGECWHDSFSTIMLFSDDFSENIQQILSPKDGKFDAVMRIKRVTLNDEKYPKYFLPLNISNSGPDFDKFCEFAKIYLTNLSKLYQNELLSIDKRIDAENLSLTCVAQSYNVNNINRKTYRKFKKNDHGGRIEDHLINSCIYNYFLREPSAKYLILKPFIINDTNKEELQELLKLLPKCFGIYFAMHKIDKAPSAGGHAIGFFQCKNKQYFFDDNGISDDIKNNKTFIEFNWKEYLTEKINDLISKDVTYTIVSDFLNGHGKDISKYGRQYLENYMIYYLILFIAQEPTNEHDFHLDNYNNYKYLTCFSSPKITSIVPTYIQKENIDTMLFNCVINNNDELLKEIVTKLKINLTVPKYNNVSLLGIAVSNASDFNKTLKYLLQFNFDINEIIQDDVYNYNLFLYGVFYNNIEFIKYLLQKNKSLINSLSIDNKSGLYIAVQNNNYDIVKLLLDNKIDFTIKMNDEVSPLQIALEYNLYDLNDEDYKRYELEFMNINKDKIQQEKDKIKQEENEKLEKNKKIIKALLDAGAANNLQDMEKMVAYAFEFNNLEGVELLFDRKYNFKINLYKYIDKYTFLDYSILYNNNILLEIKDKILYEIINSRDNFRNEKIVDLFLSKIIKPHKLNKKIITNAIELAKTESKPNISRKLLEIKI